MALYVLVLFFFFERASNTLPTGKDKAKESKTMRYKKRSQSPDERSIDVRESVDETQAINIVDRAGYPVLTFDVDDYREYVQDMGLTHEQEQELLEALWLIIVQFVDLGFGIEPVQQTLGAQQCAPQQNEENIAKGMHHGFSE